MKRMLSLVVLIGVLAALTLPAMATYERPGARWVLLMEGDVLTVPGFPVLAVPSLRLVKDGSAYNPDG